MLQQKLWKQIVCFWRIETAEFPLLQFWVPIIHLSLIPLRPKPPNLLDIIIHFQAGCCIIIFGFLRSGLLDHIVNFNAFGKQQQIKLKVNRKLLSKTAQMFLTNGVDEKTQLSLPADTDCHYLHNSEEMSAALSNCGKGKNSAY